VLEIAELLLSRIDTPRLLAGDGLLVVEHTSRTDWPVRLGGLERIRQERYGDSRISFYHFAVEG
jgi:16S rRNA G966 N2-methylase RsmD